MPKISRYLPFVTCFAGITSPCSKFDPLFVLLPASLVRYRPTVRAARNKSIFKCIYVGIQHRVVVVSHRKVFCFSFRYPIRSLAATLRESYGTMRRTRSREKFNLIVFFVVVVVVDNNSNGTAHPTLYIKTVVARFSVNKYLNATDCEQRKIKKKSASPSGMEILNIYTG